MLTLDALRGRYHRRETIASGATSEAILLPGGRPVTVGVNPASAGTPAVQISLSSHADIEADTAIWHTLTETLPVLIEGVSAIRLSAAGGSVEWEVSG